MKPLTLPLQRTPLGVALVRGERVPVEIGMEWFQALAQLVTRAGGVIGPGTKDLEALIQNIENLAGQVDSVDAQLGQLRDTAGLALASELVFQRLVVDAAPSETMQIAGASGADFFDVMQQGAGTSSAPMEGVWQI